MNQYLLGDSSIDFMWKSLVLFLSVLLLQQLQWNIDVVLAIVLVFWVN